MIERRKYKRFRAKLMMTTVYRDASGKVVVDDSIFSEDISGGGLRLSFPRKLPKGKVLDLKVFLFSDPIYLPAHGKVAWSSEKQQLKLQLLDKNEVGDRLYWVGIEFIDIDSFTRERIFHWIRKEFHVSDIEAKLK